MTEREGFDSNGKGPDATATVRCFLESPVCDLGFYAFLVSGINGTEDGESSIRFSILGF